MMKKFLSLLLILLSMLNIGACTENSSFETTGKVSDIQNTVQTSNAETTETIATTETKTAIAPSTSERKTYILNTNTLKFHRESCRYINKIS